MEKRNYGLFEKENGKWKRLFPNLAFRKTYAIQVFQNALLDFHSGKEKRLRPIKE